jgi:hypothetical protein
VHNVLQNYGVRIDTCFIVCVRPSYKTFSLTLSLSLSLSLTLALLAPFAMAKVTRSRTLDYNKCHRERELTADTSMPELSVVTLPYIFAYSVHLVKPGVRIVVLKLDNG